MSLELLEYLATQSRVVGVSMKMFEGSDWHKEDGSLFAEKFVLNCGVARCKGICSTWVCVCVDSRDVVCDTTGG